MVLAMAPVTLPVGGRRAQPPATATPVRRTGGTSVTGPGRLRRASRSVGHVVARITRPGGVLGSILRQAQFQALCATGTEPPSFRTRGRLVFAGRLHGHAAEPGRNARGSRFWTSPAGSYVYCQRKRRPSPWGGPSTCPNPSRRRKGDDGMGRGGGEKRQLGGFYLSPCGRGRKNLRLRRPGGQVLVFAGEGAEKRWSQTRNRNVISATNARSHSGAPGDAGSCPANGPLTKRASPLLASRGLLSSPTRGEVRPAAPAASESSSSRAGRRVAGCPPQGRE